jgi:hypothetical protein
VAEKLAGTGRADIADRLDRQAVLADLDAPHGAQYRAEHVVVDHVATEAAAEQARVYAGGLLDDVAAGLRREQVGHALLVADLASGSLASLIPAGTPQGRS